MNYLKVYNELIIKRRINPINKKDGFCEYHHIIPICAGGRNDGRKAKYNHDGTNIVGLTPREHYIAHLLLCKIYECSKSKVYFKLLYAVFFMGKVSEYRHRSINSHLYENLRIKYIKSIQGENNPTYGINAS